MLPRSLQEFINKKVTKLEKSFEDIQKVEVQLKVEKPATALNKTTSLNVVVPGNTLHVEKTADTLRGRRRPMPGRNEEFSSPNSKKNCVNIKKIPEKFW